MTIYNNLEFNHVIYRIAKGDLRITYKNHFELFNEYKDGSIATELSLFYIFNRTHKYSQLEEYGISEWLSFSSKIVESIEKIRPASEEVIKMFKCTEYINGTLNDAIASGNDIIFQQEHNSKSNGSVYSLKKNSDYENVDFVSKETDYFNLNLKGKLLIVSKCEFLNYHQIAKDLNVFVYGTHDVYVGARIVPCKYEHIFVKTPESDFKITIDTPIEINEIPVKVFSSLQSRFVKKVTKFKAPVFSYVVMSNDIVLGCIGFEWAKDRSYDIFLLSDFCTNNDVRLLSKLILFVIQTSEMKRALERKAVSVIDRGYTLVYTTKPVSMKYRGAFKKVHSDSNKKIKIRILPWKYWHCERCIKRVLETHKKIEYAKQMEG